MASVILLVKTQSMNSPSSNMSSNTFCFACPGSRHVISIGPTGEHAINRTGGSLSRTQISTQDVTQLCHEIRDIKKGPINNKLPDDLSKISSNIPGQWDIRDKRVLGYAKNAYNKLCPVPPSDNRDSLARRDSSPPPGPPPPAQMPPGPLPFRTPSPTSETSAETPYVTVVPGSGESPADVENRARNSPCES